jgi:hypothetical protein
MDAPDNKRFKMTVDPIEEEIDLGRFSKPEAPSLEIFLAEPSKYRPRPEFLEGAASYVEVCCHALTLFHFSVFIVIMISFHYLSYFLLT